MSQYRVVAEFTDAENDPLLEAYKAERGNYPDT